MKCLFSIVTLLAAFAPTSLIAEAPHTRAVPLIFDTDLGNDCDDVLAMGMIHALQSRSECELIAVTTTKDHPLAAPFADVVNTFYGRGDIPIGVCRSGITTDAGKFNGLASERDGDQDRYPHDLRSGKEAAGAIEVLRRALASQADRSVVIVQVGFSTNLAQLLASSGDQTSPLSGSELVKKKVRLLSVMAGAFQPIPDNQGKPADYREYNVVQDIPSARTLAKDWPTPIVWSGFEIGIALPYPHQSIEQDFNYVSHHPLAEAYRLYIPPPHDRPTWDLTSVLHAIRPDRGYFDLSPAGQVTVAEDGLTTFKQVEGGRDRYLIVRNEQKGKTTEALVQLSSQPPQSSSLHASRD